jgi:hypothetical protein
MFKGRKCAGKMESVQENDGKCTGINGRSIESVGSGGNIFMFMKT